MTIYDGWQVRAYFENVHHKAQESRAKVSGTTRQKTQNARMIGFPTMDPAEGSERTNRFEPTQNNTPARRMRWVFPRDYTINMMEDDLDASEHFWQAESEYVISEAAAMNREMTRRLAAAALGNSLETDQDTIGQAGAPTVVPLPAGQIIPHGSVGATKAKYVQARTKLDVAVGGDVETMGPYYTLYNPLDFQTLSNESEFNTLDSVSRQQLMDGKVVNGLLGFNWIPTSTLPVNASNIRTNVCWARFGMGCGRNGAVKMRAGERADLSYAMQVYRSEKYDYVRIDDKMVVGVEIDTSGLFG